MPYEFSISVKVPRIPLLLRGRARAIVQEEINASALAMMEGIAERARRLTRERASDTKALERGIKAEVTVGNRARMIVEGDASRYAHIISETGRRAGAKMPPDEPLRAWARRKGIEERTFLVRRAIARRGIRPRYIFRDAIAAEGPKLPRILAGGVGRLATRIIKRL